MRVDTKSLLGVLFVFLGTVGIVGGNALVLEPGQLPPKRLYSNGDPITQASLALG